MGSVLAYLATLFGPLLVNIETKLFGAFTAILGEQPQDQKQILHDAIDAFVKDRASGKSYGEAAADALSTFFSEEKGEVNKATLQFFQAFLAGTE